MLATALTYFLMQGPLCLTGFYYSMFIKNLGVSYVVLGIGTALYEIVGGIISPLFAGAYVDRTGRIRSTIAFLIIANILLLWGVVALPGKLVPLLFVILASIPQRSLTNVQDTAGMLASRHNVDTYSRLRACETLGACLFSLFYAFLSRPDPTDNRDIFFCVLIASIPYFCASLFLKDREGEKAATVPMQAQGKWYDRAFVLALVLAAVNHVAWAPWSAFLAPWLIEEVHAGHVIIFQAVSTAAEFFAMLAAGQILAKKRVRPVFFLALSPAAAMVRCLVYAFFPTVGGAALGAVLHAFVFGTFQPALVAYIGKHTAAGAEGKGIAAFWSLGSCLPMMVGSWIGGYLVEYGGWKTMDCFFAAVAALDVALFIAFRKRLVKIDV